jgi:endoglucanase
MKRKNQIIMLLMLPAILAACSSSETTNSVKIIYNQVGYITDAPKMLLVTEDVDEVEFADETGKVVLTANAAPALYWEQSGDAVRKVDFSEITTPGKFFVTVPRTNQQYEILISDRPYEQVTKDALKSFYYNRSGMPIEPQFGGTWARAAGHPDTVILVHTSAADKNRPEGTILSSPGGWYDAGDYNKYIVNSGISTYTMFRALDDYPEYFSQLQVNIPQTAGVPDLLAETLYNYNWMLTMQDPADGGVYHKLTNKNFDGVVMPHEATNERYVVSKGTAATLDFAAVAAKAYRSLKPWEDQFPGLAATSLAQAEKAWEWAVANPEIYYKQPEDIQTGAYGDSNLDDEFFWAAAELYLATGKPEYLQMVVDKYSKPSVPTWQDVISLGFLSLMDQYETLPAEIKDLGIREDFFALVDNLTNASQNAPYGVSIENFVWGSNSSVANEGMLKMAGYRYTGNQAYLHSAMADLDYIMGRNATGYCFVTGFGNQKVMNIHHRPSEADGIEEPVPGFLAGGPNTATFDDCPDMERSNFPAKSFVDHWCSYSTNEIAVNWNAPLVYLLGAIDSQKR